MKLWPWQSLYKELKKRLDESKSQECVKYTPEEFFEILKNKPITPFYKEWWLRFKWGANDFSWNVYRFFKPCNKRIRKVIPKNWIDLDELIRVANFEILLQFYEEEYKDAYVEFDTEFVLWLEKSYEYIKHGRDNIQNEINSEFNIIESMPYNNRSYSSIWDLEKKMENMDTDILVNMMKYRGHFWT